MSSNYQELADRLRRSLNTWTADAHKAAESRSRELGFEFGKPAGPAAEVFSALGDARAVLTDAPAFMLEVLVDSHDGWLDEDDAPGEQGTPLPPLHLPTAPKRIKRPDLG